MKDELTQIKSVHMLFVETSFKLDTGALRETARCHIPDKAVTSVILKEILIRDFGFE